MYPDRPHAAILASALELWILTLGEQPLTCSPLLAKGAEAEAALRHLVVQWGAPGPHLFIEWKLMAATQLVPSGMLAFTAVSLGVRAVCHMKPAWGDLHSPAALNM